MRCSFHKRRQSCNFPDRTALSNTPKRWKHWGVGSINKGRTVLEVQLNWVYLWSDKETTFTLGPYKNDPLKGQWEKSNILVALGESQRGRTSTEREGKLAHLSATRFMVPLMQCCRLPQAATLNSLGRKGISQPHGWICYGIKSVTASYKPSITGLVACRTYIWNCLMWNQTIGSSR